ncbi:MAG: CARDB domain-containing protein [Fimbriimonas sp.]
MLLIAALALATPQEVATIELVRGSALPNQAIGYWDVTDTYLDAQQPDRNFGGEGVLLGGMGRTILIRFGDLRRAVGAGKVRKATLILTPSGGALPELRSIAKASSAWGEGPVLTLGALLERTALERAAKKDPAKEVPPLWSATWKSRRAGENGLNWQQPGAAGPADASLIADAKLVGNESNVSIVGLEAAVQSMIGRPYENHGFVLNFSKPAEFFSSQSPFNRPRLVVEMEPAAPKSGPDLSVVAIERLGSPKEGEEATYVAHVKNVGNAAAKGFSTTWSIREGGGPVQDLAQSLEPGAEATVTLKRPYKFNALDHRLQPVSLRINPTGPDASAANNYLEIQESGRTVEVVAPAGSEDSVQEQVRLFNEVIAPFSRYSFAREGALERVSVQRNVSSASEPLAADARVVWQQPLASGVDVAFQRALGKALGLPDLAVTQYMSGDRNALVTRGSTDIYPGIMGYGDTRFDGSLLGAITLLYEPYWNALTESQPVEATGLLSLTDVALLNQMLSRQTSASEVMKRIPDTVLLRAMDLIGRPLPNMELSFFQSQGGKFAIDPPVFSVVTDARGSAVLPKRTGGLFGEAPPDGLNSVFLVSASANGVTEWGWLKGWQLVDAYNRGGPGAAVFDMRFNLPGAPVDTGVDLALERLLADSLGTAPAVLAPLNDGNPATAVKLGPKKGDWIEVDLGRDRTIAEIDVLAAAPEMWPRFDVLVYGTGQKLVDATVWAREQDWNWTATNRRELVSGVPSVAYRGQPLRVRYIRLVNKLDQPGQIGGIRILPAKL